MSPLVSLLLGYLVGSIATYYLWKKHWVVKGANTAIDMLMQNNYVRWRKVKGEIEFLKVNEDSKG